MIFMSQSGITDSSLEESWGEWYVEHLRIMRTVDGIDSAQRFKTLNPDWPPSLAMYSIRSPDVFQDPYYQKIRGMGPWLERIDRKFYRRNLFDGVEDDKSVYPPVVATGEALVVTDCQQPAADIGGLTFLWLKTIALDHSTPFRGISVMSQQQAAALPLGPSFAVYLPD
jgi:hypothetical protein